MGSGRGTLWGVLGLVFKNNGPGGCCCGFCPAFPDSLETYSDDFSGDLSGWWSATGSIVSGRWRQTAASGGSFFNNFKTENHDNTSIDFEATTFFDATATNEMTIYDRRQGTFGANLVLFRAVPDRPSQSGRFFCGKPGATTTVLQLPVSGETRKIEVRPNATAGKFDFEYFVAGISIHSETIDWSFDEPCEFSIGQTTSSSPVIGVGEVGWEYDDVSISVTS